MKKEGFWPERKSAIIESLEGKINFVRSLRDRLQLLPVETPIEDFNKVIDDWWEELLLRLPHSISEGFVRYEQLDSELEVLDKKEGSVPLQEISDLYLERDTLDKDTFYYMTFLETMSKVKENLKGKHAQVIQTNENELKNTVKDVLKIDQSGIIEVRKGILSVNIIIKREYMKKIPILERGRGLHISGTPLNLIVQSNKPEEIDYTIDHENIHNIFKAVRESSPSSLSVIFKNNLKRYKRINALHNLPENIKAFITKGAFDFKNYLDSPLIHSELAAFLISTFHHLKLVKPKDFLSLGSSLQYLSGLRDSIDGEIKRAKASKDKRDKFLVTRIEDLKRRLFERFLNISETIVEILGLLRKALYHDPHSLIQEEVEILFFILPPTQYSIIPKYLRSKLDLGNTKG